MCPLVDSSVTCSTIDPTQFKKLNNAGIHADLITATDQSVTYIASYGSSKGVKDALEAYEGPNECDAGDCSGNWAAVEGALQRQIFALASPAVKIIGPSMTTQNGYAALGNLSAYMDFGNIHDYVGANAPETPDGAVARISWVAIMSGNKPVWSTEFGHSTDPSYANNGVPEIIQERYLPRALLEHLRLGITRTYIYQLFDFGNDGGHFMGLLRADYSPKPAWTGLLQLVQFFSDSGTSPQQKLPYAATGDKLGMLDHLLFQRSDGTFLLALWLADSVFDPNSHAVKAPAAETITLTFPPSVSSATLMQFNDEGQIVTNVVVPSSGMFFVTVTSLVSVLSFHE